MVLSYCPFPINQFGIIWNKEKGCRISAPPYHETTIKLTGRVCLPDRGWLRQAIAVYLAGGEAPFFILLSFAKPCSPVHQSAIGSPNSMNIGTMPRLASSSPTKHECAVAFHRHHLHSRISKPFIENRNSSTPIKRIHVSGQLLSSQRSIPSNVRPSVLFWLPRCGL
jgi:hypothetical protein